MRSAVRISVLNTETRKCGMRMHCNVRPPDAAPVLIRFYYDAHSKFKVAQPKCCRLIAADTVLYSVTLTFYL